MLKPSEAHNKAIHPGWLCSVSSLVWEGELPSGANGPLCIVAEAVANDSGFTTTLFPPGEREMEGEIPECCISVTCRLLCYEVIELAGYVTVHSLSSLEQRKRKLAALALLSFLAAHVRLLRVQNCRAAIVVVV